MKIRTELVDQRSIARLVPQLVASISKSKVIGFDIETHDGDRHEGLNRFCKYNEDTGKRPENGKLVFDMQRTTVTGLSIYCDGDDVAYYLNLNHADVANRLPWPAVRSILDSRPPDAYLIAHNAPFELTAMGNSLGFEIERIICTLQLAVSVYGPDEFSVDQFRRKRLGAMAVMIEDLIRASANYDQSKDRNPSPRLMEVMGKVTAKESDAAHSYNGWISEISYGYGLKRAVESHFDYKMSTFADTLGDKAHMGQLAGEQVAEYGAEDAYWAVRLFHHLIGMLKERAPNAVGTFFSQENPMVHIFADAWRDGCKIDIDRVHERRQLERINFAQVLRELKVAILETGGFRADHDPRLAKREAWYEKNHAKYRALIWNWATSSDKTEAFAQCNQIRSPVSNAWAADLGVPESAGPNLVHYMPQRVMLYDLLQLPLKVVKGKVQSDAECRGKLLDKARRGAEADEEEDETLKGWHAMAPAAVKVLECLSRMSSLEQRMKLYLTPYVHLTDPKTSNVYPVLSSKLATRRMAAQYPNGMQLAKRGESVYVRSFWQPDYDDHVVFSRDWSAIELLIIGEQSKDPEFAKVYGQLPHGDLHAGAASDVLSVQVPGLTEEAFHDLKKVEKAIDFSAKYGLTPDGHTRLFTDLKGDALSPGKANKYWRTEIGKGSNFSYWYSGWLGDVAEKMGWTPEETAQAVNRYTSRFWVAEQWRRSVIADGIRHGFIELPDGHRRYRYEATERWKEEFTNKWPLMDDLGPVEGFNGAIREIARRIHKRSHNQLVNAMVQGTCATLAKRSILRIKDRLKAEGLTKREVRFMLPVHDELVYSVHRDCVVLFDKISREEMNNHPDLFPTLMVDSSPSIGLNFEPWHKKDSRLGQIELYEPPGEVVGDKLADTRLGANEIPLVVDWLFAEKGRSQ